MQPDRERGLRLPERLVNGGFNDTQDNVSRGLEEGGVPHDVSVMAGHWYAVAFFIGVLFLLVRYFGWIGKKRRPPKKKRKK